MSCLDGRLHIVAHILPTYFQFVCNQFLTAFMINISIPKCYSPVVPSAMIISRMRGFFKTSSNITVRNNTYLWNCDNCFPLTFSNTFLKLLVRHLWCSRMSSRAEVNSKKTVVFQRWWHIILSHKTQTFFFFFFHSTKVQEYISNLSITNVYYCSWLYNFYLLLFFFIYKIFL